MSCDPSRRLKRPDWPNVKTWPPLAIETTNSEPKPHLCGEPIKTLLDLEQLTAAS